MGPCCVCVRVCVMWFVGGAQVMQVVKEATGSILNKIEIGVHFFQMYALMVLLTFNIHWPHLWKELKSVFDWPANLFSIDLVGAFAMIKVKLSPNIQVYARFAIVMSLPLLFFGLYWKANTMDQKKWYGRCVCGRLCAFVCVCVPPPT